MNDRASDAELIAASAVSADSFAELYERHFDSVLRFFYSRTGCPQTAADLCAETFAAAFASRRRFVDVGVPGRAWLFKIAHRQLNRFIRRQVVDKKARQKLGVSRVELSNADIERIEALVDFEPIAATLKKEIEALPSSQSEALSLRFGANLPFKEIAAELGCSEGAARVRVSRALAALAVRLGDET